MVHCRNGGWPGGLFTAYDCICATTRRISGERCYLAKKAAGLAAMPSCVQTPSDNEILLRQLSENWQRAELNPFE